MSGLPIDYLSEKLAMRVRTALGPHNDSDLPVTQCVDMLVAELTALRERVARLDSELMAAQVEARLWNDAVKDRRVLPIGSYYGPDDKVPVRQP